MTARCQTLELSRSLDPRAIVIAAIKQVSLRKLEGAECRLVVPWKLRARIEHRDSLLEEGRSGETRGSDRPREIEINQRGGQNAVSSAFCWPVSRNGGKTMNEEGSSEDLWSHRSSSRGRPRRAADVYVVRGRAFLLRTRRRGAARGSDRRGRKEQYTRGIPNDFVSFGEERREGGGGGGGKRPWGPPQRSEKSRRGERQGEGPGPSRARRFLRFNILPSRLLFGPDGNSAKCID